MVETTGRIKAGSVYGPEITHYTSTGGLNFQLPNQAEAFFDLISGYPTAGQPNPPSAQIVLIGELQPAGTPQRFALETGSRWTPALMSSLTGQTVVEVTY